MASWLENLDEDWVSEPRTSPHSGLVSREDTGLRRDDAAQKNRPSHIPRPCRSTKRILGETSNNRGWYQRPTSSTSSQSSRCTQIRYDEQKQLHFHEQEKFGPNHDLIESSHFY